jgi:hypothetical protein
MIKAKGDRYSFNIISAVNAQGIPRFMIVDGTVTASTFSVVLVFDLSAFKRSSLYI